MSSVDYIKRKVYILLCGQVRHCVRILAVTSPVWSTGAPAFNGFRNSNSYNFLQCEFLCKFRKERITSLSNFNFQTASLPPQNYKHTDDLKFLVLVCCAVGEF